MSNLIPASVLDKFTTFGDLLRYLRRRRGLTQSEMSIAVGYSVSGASATKTRHVEMQHANFGQFKTPSLRNVAVTGPYMHDGRLATLEEVVALYRRGGVPNPNLDEKIQPLAISDAEAADLVTFLKEGFASDSNLKALALQTVGADQLGF